MLSGAPMRAHLFSYEKSGAISSIATTPFLSTQAFAMIAVNGSFRACHVNSNNHLVSKISHQNFRVEKEEREQEAIH
jgi:hypothetical protein